MFFHKLFKRLNISITSKKNFHRDFKAANNLVWTKDIKVKILDFGSAHSLDKSF